jgi:hypothetical protein
VSSYLALAELLLVFGGVLVFAVWQLRSLKRDQQRTRMKEPDET